VFAGFELERVDVGEAELRVRHGGSGPAVLLLHGHPRTHATWHKVAARLADGFSVVCPDLRGYGESSKPPTTGDHEPYSKRAMARDCVRLMSALGHERFAVVGHDRGCYVAMRVAMDNPSAVTRYVAIDGVPIGEALTRCDAAFARAWWHWFFLGNPDPKVERSINVDPEAWYGAGEDKRRQMGDAAYEDWLRAINDPATVHAMCEDYRAGLTIDRANDDADRAAGRRIQCPTLVVWATYDDMEALYGDPVAVWEPWTTDVRGLAIESGHHIAEDAPAELAAAVAGFIGGAGAEIHPKETVTRRRCC
jgi:haloacetate dehalogenase